MQRCVNADQVPQSHASLATFCATFHLIIEHVYEYLRYPQKRSTTSILSTHPNMDQPASPESTPQNHDLEHITEQLSPTARLALIILCLAAGLSIAYIQVVQGRKEAEKLREPPSRTISWLRVARSILLNAISGALLMMATSIGAREESLATFETGFHSLLDPHTTQSKIDCFRIHAVHWIQYTSGWQMLKTLLKHTYNLHVWALPMEVICAIGAFISFVAFSKRDLRLKAALSVGALAHCSFPAYWTIWVVFASLFLTHLDEPKMHRAPLLPLFEPGGRKSSRPTPGSGSAHSGAYRFGVVAFGLYLLSANFYRLGAFKEVVHKIWLTTSKAQQLRIPSCKRSLRASSKM